MFLDKFVLHGLLGAATLPLTALSAASIIDSAWAVVRRRHRCVEKRSRV